MKAIQKICRKIAFQRKAQLTLFIILGLVIIISTVLFLTLKGSIERKEIAPGVSMIVEELPSEFLPIQPFVENCLEKTAQQGLIIMGQRGGYIYSKRLKPRQQPTEGDSVRFSLQSELILPYWFYLSSPNNCMGECEFKSEKLALRKNALHDSVENQLALYIEENLGACLADFKGIKELGFDVEEQGKPKVKVIVAENDIVVQLEFPITVSRHSSLELRNFYVNLDLNLNRLYKMADYITELEKEYRFLERAALNLIVGFSGKDTKKLPPMSDSSFGTKSSIRWRKTTVKNNLRNILVAYIPLLRMVNTLNWKEIDTGSLYIDKLYNYGMSIPNNISINDLAVNFNYFDFWDIYFDLNCNGEVCEPESAFTDLLPIGMQRYNFAYDVSFPVLVEIEDPSAFNDRGYTFNFMLESNIRNNRAMPALFTPTISISEEGSMLCDENKRNSGKVTIEAIDSLDNSRLDGVGVIYTCIDSCYIGETKDGILETALPICFGGMLSFRKDGYAAAYLEYDAYLDKKDELKILLNPEKGLRVEVKKKKIIKQGNDWIFLDSAVDLEEFETAIITLTKEPEFNILEIKKDSNESITVTEGTYEIEISLISDIEYYIPPETKSFAGRDVHVEEFNLSSIVVGRTMINYTFSKEDLAMNKIVLFVLAADIFSIPINERSVDDLQITNNFDVLTKKYYYELTPGLK